MPLGKRGEGKAKRERRGRRRGAWEGKDRGRRKSEGEDGKDSVPSKLKSWICH